MNNVVTFFKEIQGDLTPEEFMLNILGFSSLAAMVVVVIFAFFIGSKEVSAVAVAGVGVITGAAALLAGSLIGFLFGIPRTLQRQDRVNTQNNTDQKETGATYEDNTNLEQISDWLTKILVGVGLTQIGKMPAKLGELAIFLKPGLGNNAASEVFGVVVVLVFSFDGFLIGYLWTRLYLATALRRQNLKRLEEFISETEKQRQEQQKNDLEVLKLVDSMLNQSAAIKPESIKRLNDLIPNTSQFARQTIFAQAQKVRNENWRDHKAVMERTIPVFDALMKSDEEAEENHTYRGQLGYALKDKRNPDFQKASEMLTKAIKIRGPWESNGYVYYELIRAICEINLDANFGNNQPAESATKESIVADLEVGFSEDYVREGFKDQILEDWLIKNSMSMDDL